MGFRIMIFALFQGRARRVEIAQDSVPDAIRLLIASDQQLKSQFGAAVGIDRIGGLCFIDGHVVHFAIRSARRGKTIRWTPWRRMALSK